MAYTYLAALLLFATPIIDARKTHQRITAGKRKEVVALSQSLPASVFGSSARAQSWHMTTTTCI